MWVRVIPRNRLQRVEHSSPCAARYLLRTRMCQ